MEYLSVGACCLFVGYLIGRIQTSAKYSAVLAERDRRVVKK